MLAKGLDLADGETIDNAEMDAHVEMFLDHYLANIAVTSQPFENAIAAVEEMLAAGAKMAICTNKREAPARQLDR